MISHGHSASDWICLRPRFNFSRPEFYFVDPGSCVFFAASTQARQILGTVVLRLMLQVALEKFLSADTYSSILSFNR